MANSVGLNSVISQLQGGPLEKIVHITEEVSNICIIQAHFFRAKDAHAFYSFSKSGRFLVNGQIYYPRWASACIANIYPLSKKIFEEMEYNGARRCLTLTRKAHSLDTSTGEIGVKLKRHNVLLKISIEKIKQDFSNYGPIVAVCPLISPTISISIQFADVRCAIRAKKMFEHQTDLLSQIYMGWILSYGKDPTDRRCPVSL